MKALIKKSVLGGEKKSIFLLLFGSTMTFKAVKPRDHGLDTSETSSQNKSSLLYAGVHDILSQWKQADTVPNI